MEQGQQPCYTRDVSVFICSAKRSEHIALRIYIVLTHGVKGDTVVHRMCRTLTLSRANYYVRICCTL